jgi:ComF family protein
MEIDGIRSVFRFEGTVRQAVFSFKYKNVKALAAPLAQLMEEYLQANPLPADALVPVPLHPRRVRQRGYNQSSLLAGELSKLALLPLVEGPLVRLKNTPPQTRTKSAEERQSNVAGAFFCRDQRLEGRRILLIDDVCTSGATLNACAAALKAAGVTSVWGLTLAREV